MELISAESQYRKLNEEGKHADAVPFAQAAVRLAGKEFGPNHYLIAISLNDLAHLYNSQGHYADAEPLYKRALAIDEKALGSDHPSTASILSNLAQFYKDTGYQSSSLDYIRRAVSIRRARATRSGGNEAGRTSVSTAA